jgi:hypothetical protein
MNSIVPSLSDDPPYDLSFITVNYLDPLASFKKIAELIG